MYVDVPEYGEIRLYYSMYTPDYYRGAVQVWLNNQWTAVSNDSWTVEDGEVVCHQLGYRGRRASELYRL